MDKAALLRVDRFRVDGVDYLRGGAGAVQLGDVGAQVVFSGAVGGRQLAVRAGLPRDMLKIARATQVDIHRAGIDGADIGEAPITVPGVGALGAATLARHLEDQTLGLVRLDCLPQDIARAANASPAVLGALLGAGRDARLVHQVFLIVEMRAALNLARCSAFEVGGDAERCWVVAGRGGPGGGSLGVVPITPGTTFAYRLLAPRWNAAAPGERTRIDGWDDEDRRDAPGGVPESR